jgi:hypothetical protein
LFAASLPQPRPSICSCAVQAWGSACVRFETVKPVGALPSAIAYRPSARPANRRRRQRLWPIPPPPRRHPSGGSRGPRQRRPQWIDFAREHRRLRGPLSEAESFQFSNPIRRLRDGAHRDQQCGTSRRLRMAAEGIAEIKRKRTRMTPEERRERARLRSETHNFCCRCVYFREAFRTCGPRAAVCYSEYGGEDGRIND